MGLNGIGGVEVVDRDAWLWKLEGELRGDK